MDSPFMTAFAEGIAVEGVRVARFEFPYMAGRRHGGSKRPPDRQPVLLDTWQRVVDHFGPDRLVIGGKSMGGRMASMIAEEAGVRGLVCLGYPFHPPGKPEKTRTAHLAGIRTPTLILQGTRDALGSRETVETYQLSPAIRIRWSEDGDHHLVPRKASGRTGAENRAAGITAIGEFLASL